MRATKLQGKGAKAVMARLAPGLNVAKMNFMTGTVATVAGTTHEQLCNVLTRSIHADHSHRHPQLPRDPLRLHWRGWIRDLRGARAGGHSRQVRLPVTQTLKYHQ